MRAPAPLLALLAAGCDGGMMGGDPQVTANQIERLATPPADRRDPQASARLQPITPDDLQQQGLAGAGCRFSRDGRMYLAAVDSNAIVRIGGEIRHLVHSAPVGPSGGFFEDRQLSISVGRTDDMRAPADATRWPARITVTNRRTEVQRRQRGVWTCGA